MFEHEAESGSHLLLELPQLIIAPAIIAGIHGGLHQLAQAEEDISCSSVQLLVQARTQTVDTPLRQPAEAQQSHWLALTDSMCAEWSPRLLPGKF